MNIPDDLKPGDILLYNDPKSIVDFIIRVKTWGTVAHVEMYAGKGMSYASRNGVGVNYYGFRKEGLVYVLRPVQPFDLSAATKWCNSTLGQKYDFLGLLCFTLAVKRGSPDRMFCSEAIDRVFKKINQPITNTDWDSDMVAPDDFLILPESVLFTVWRDFSIVS